MAALRLLAVVALFLSACVPAPRTAAPVEIAGVLSGTTVLSGEVLLTADVLVPRGAALVVEPGTTVRVRPAEGTKIDPEYLSPLTELLVRGTLHVAGTREAPVVFAPSAETDAGEVAWAGILLDRAAAGEVSGAHIVGAEHGVLCIGASPGIRDSRIERCRYGVVAQQGSAPVIRDCVIADGEGGVFCWRSSHPLLAGNRIAGNGEEGLFVDRSSRPRLEGNVVTGNAIGLALFRDDLAYDAGLVTGNGEDVRLLGRGE